MKLNRLALPSPPAIVGYGAAVLSVAAALGLIRWMETVQLPAAHVSLFLCAVMFSAWFGGARPGLVAIALSALALAYFFLRPTYSLAVEPAELPRLVLYVLSALFVGSLSAAQRSAAQSLRHARDDQQKALDGLTRVNEALQAENRERRRAEEKLREQAGLLDLTHDTVFVRDINDVITYWNRGAEERYGWTREEALDKVSHQLTQTVFPAPLAEINAELHRTGRWEGELIHTKRDGTEVVVASRWSLQRDERGRPVTILETNNDITERKRWRSLTEALPQLVWAATPDGACDYFSTQWTEYTGVAETDLLGWRWMEVLHPDDRENTRRLWGDSVAGRRDYDVEYRVRRHDGAYGWFKTRGTPIRDSEGRIIKWFGTCTDITDQKRAEQALYRSEQELRRARDQLEMKVAERTAELTRTNERLQAENRERERAEEKLREQAGLLDLTHDTVFVRDMDDVITYWNRGAEERYGWKSEEAIGQVSHQLLQTIFPEPQVFPDPLEEIMATLFHTGGWDGELVHAKRDGTRVTVASRWALQRDAAGRPVEILETNNDITERKRAERALEQALRESEERRRAAEALAQVGRVLTERLDVTVVFRRIVENLHELFAADVASVLRHEPSGELLLLLTIGESSDANGLSILPPGHGVAGLAVRERRPVVTADLAADPRFTYTPELRASVAAKPWRAVLAVPLIAADRVLGVLAVRRTQPFDEQAVSLAQAFADQAVIALENARLYQQVSAAYEDLARTQEELRRVGRATTLGALAASIAHEVNQPLGAVVTSAASCSRWLAGEPPDLEKARRALDRIVRDGQRASEVIVRIRALVTRRPPRTDPVDINESVRDVLPLARGEMERSGVVLRTRFAQDLPLVPGDRVQLQQVILNLIVNGIEAMSDVADRPRELVVSSAAHGSRGVVVEVHDSGSGLDPERADQLFEAFYSTKPEGTGMGLTISRSIVEAHGGRLWATANAPHGAVFRFSLPAEEDAP